MNHYDVTIRETLEVKMKVAANSREEAEQFARDQWKRGEVVLDASRFTGVEFHANGVADDQILEMNFESMSIPEMDARGFYEYVKARICPDKRTYLFFDEVQKVPGWENAVNSFRVDFDCDIYITGSNAYLLSSELSTYLSGRYVEIKVLPLSFREFLDFHGYTLTERKSPAGGVKKRIMDADGEVYDARELYDAYTRFGGMPMLADIGLEINRVTAALDGMYSAAVINDILEREKRKGQRTITDAVLLRKIIMFLADNIGNNTSATSIGNTLAGEGLLEDGKRKTKPAVQTIQAYIKALTEAYEEFYSSCDSPE